MARLSDTNNLQVKFPLVAKELHPTKNSGLTADKLTPRSARKCWWRCGEGHEWEAKVANRTNPKATGCPYCSGRKVTKETSLAGSLPSVAREWLPSKNGSLEPEQVAPASNKRVWWKCVAGHEWRAIVSSRTRPNGTGCPYCGNRAVDDSNSLLAVKPQLAKQWHPTKNRSLSPNDVLPGSGKKVWWQCAQKHEYRAAINNRDKGTGCPFCAGKHPTKSHNLKVQNPHLASEWHPTKNAGLTPDKVTPGSNKKVWWKCKFGHEWRASIVNRKGCPYCSNKAVGDENNLAKTLPELAVEWHPTRNGKLRPEHVTAGSGKSVWWLCQFGHEWRTAVVTRGGLGTGCPKCSPQSSRIEIRVFAELKKLLGEAIWRHKVEGLEVDIYLPGLGIGIEVDGHYWHKDKKQLDLAKNNTLTRAGLTLLRVREKPLEPLAEQDIQFASKESHVAIMQRLIASLRMFDLPSDASNRCATYLSKRELLASKEYKELVARLPGPIEGTSLADKCPELVPEWHPVRNGSLTPQMFSVGSGMNVWWMCKKGHEWQTTIHARSGTRRLGCPYCSGRRASEDRNFATMFPEIAREWDCDRNGDLSPRDISPYSGKKYSWRCQQGHSWGATADNRARGRGCPYCSGNRLAKERSVAAMCPNLIEEWHPSKNGDLTPLAVPAGSDRKIWWLCAKGHEWQAAASSRKQGTGCPYCAGNLVTPERSLAVVCPQLVADWDTEANGQLTPQDITVGSGKKAHWVCARGHKWQAAIFTRAKGHGCPVCARQRRTERGKDHEESRKD